MRTQREFLEALKKERNGWRVRRGEIRRGTREKLTIACPMSAVATTILGAYYPPWGIFETAAEIGMPKRLASAIVDASDSAPTMRRRRLRKRMLAVLGLSE